MQTAEEILRKLRKRPCNDYPYKKQAWSQFLLGPSDNRLGKFQYYLETVDWTLILIDLLLNQQTSFRA